MNRSDVLDPEVAAHFRTAFREARASALRDAEGWMDVVIVLEQLIAHHVPNVHNLARAREPLRRLAARSSLAEKVPAKWRTLHTPFTELFDHVRRGRNAAVHQGAAARRLTAHAVELALILEHAMTPSSDIVRDYMVRDPIRVLPWQPVSFVRHQMLVNSFSYLPVHLELDGERRWWLISDGALARYLRAQSNDGGDARLRTSVQKAVESKQLQLIRAKTVRPTDAVDTIFSDTSGLPVLVESGTPPELVGILTPFDLL